MAFSKQRVRSVIAFTAFLTVGAFAFHNSALRDARPPLLLAAQVPKTKKDEQRLEGKFLIHWKESTGKTGELEYEFRPDKSVWRTGRSVGVLQSKGGKLIVHFEDAKRGEVVVNSVTADTFSGDHLWKDGRRATWKAERIQPTKDESTETPELPDGQVALFNGNDLDGWKFVVAPAVKEGFDILDCWDVDAERGVLFAKGVGPTWFATEQTYDNFTLALEWRFVPNSPLSPNGSGVVIRSAGIHSSKLDPRGIEIDLSEKNSGAFLCYGSPLTSVKGKAAGEATQKLDVVTEPELQKLGDWNTTEIVCDGDRITVTINGEIVNEATGARVKKGEICLRSQKSGVEFRKIRLAAITAEE